MNIRAPNESPEKYEWEGGVRAGYVIQNSKGEEICRVWCENWAVKTLEKGSAKPEWLVDYILGNI